MLVQQTYRPADAAALSRTLELIGRLGRQAELYRLRCNMDISAAETSYGAIFKSYIFKH